jgi:hypothetical protein
MSSEYSGSGKNQASGSTAVSQSVSNSVDMGGLTGIAYAATLLMDILGGLVSDVSFGTISLPGLPAFFYQSLPQYRPLKDNYDLAINYYNTNIKDYDFFATTYAGGTILPPTSFVSSPDGAGGPMVAGDTIAAGATLPGGNMIGALTEAMQRPLYETGPFSPQYGMLDYIASTGRGASMGARRLDKQWYATRRRMPKYQTGLGKWLDYKFSMGKVNETLNGWNLGFRYEDHRKEIYDEQRHGHRTNILNLGIGVGNSARRGLATAVGQLSEARSNLSSNMSSALNGAAQNIAANSQQKKTSATSSGQTIKDTSGIYMATQGLSTSASNGKGYVNRNDNG